MIKDRSVKENYMNELSVQVKKKSDRVMNYFLPGFFLAGLALAFYYDTWLIAIGVGLLSLAAYYSSKLLLPQSNLYQYVLAVILGIFMAQFIYQMHGLFEMHFLAFISSAILITYRNWKLQIPLAIIVIVHHATFGYLQFKGFGNVYFTQLDHMSMDNFLIHILLATLIFSLCGLWAYHFKVSGENYALKSFEIGKLQEANNQKDVMVAMSDNLKQSNHKLQQANAELENIFNTIQDVLFSMDIKNKKFIKVSIACINVYGYTPEDFLTNNDLWKAIIHPDDRYIAKEIEEALNKGRTVSNQYRILHRYKETRWVETKMVPTVDENGITIRVDGISIDITEKIKLESSLAEEKKKQQQHITAAVITAQERERSFLGEELHDNINPILATARLYLDCATTQQLNREKLVKDSKDFITMAMEEIRTLSKKLVPPSLGRESLTEALSQLMENIMQVNKIKFVTNFDCNDESAMKDELKLAIYRITQEQVSNILKHAKANVVHITLQHQGDCLKLIIKDDGVGFNVDQKRNGVGLQNISSRTEVFNGTVQLNSRPGEGCQLMIQFPVKRAVKTTKKFIRA